MMKCEGEEKREGRERKNSTEKGVVIKNKESECSEKNWREKENKRKLG